MKAMLKFVFISLFFATMLPAQEMRFQSAGPGEVFMIPEVSALLRASDNTVKVEMAMPEHSRPEVYKNIDIKTGDIVLFLNSKRIKALSDFTSLYDSLKTDEMVEIGLKRDDMRFIASFKKADPASLPQRRIMTMSSDGGGSFTTSEVRPGGQRVTMEPNEIEREMDDLQPVLELGAVFGGKGAIVKVARKLPLPAEGLKEDAIQEGDVIKKLNGKEITSLQHFIDQFGKIKVGDAVELISERDGKSLTHSFAKPASRGRMMIRRDEN